MGRAFTTKGPSTVRSHPRIAWKGLELQIYFHENLRGANIATMLVISRGPSVIGKTMVWATKVVGRGVVNDVFKNDHYMGFLLRKYRENGQNHTFRPFEPPKWPFLC